MNMKRLVSLFLSWSVITLTTLVFLGCEIDSAESVTRNVGIDFTGFYDSTGTNTDFVSPANSGARVTSLNLMQSGDTLEAIDNNSRIFRGSLGSVDDTTASFTLEGSTTAGNEVTITGTLSGDAAAETALMKGTWIEPGLYAVILGDAKINPIATNQPSPQPTNALAVTASATSIGLNESSLLSASGGSGTYTLWSLSNGNLGQLTATSGDSTTYVANSTVGTNTITVTDSASATASVTISQGP